MSKTLDQTSDLNGQQLYRLTRLYPLPPFVKKASSIEICGGDDMENYQYADPIKRRFPCHTGPATYISTLFFMDKKAEIDTDDARFIESRLDDFAFYHGITGSIATLKEKLTGNSKVASIDKLPDDVFALILNPDESTSGIVERHYPLRNALEVKKAAEWLQTHETTLPYTYRQKMASKILTKADKYGASLGDLDNYLQKQAGLGVCAAYDAARLVFDRARLLKQAGKLEYAIKVGEIAKTIANNPATVQNQDQLIKLAGLIDEIDKTTGLNRFVDDLQRPEDVFFNITEKAAAELRRDHFATTSGNIYKSKDLAHLKLADVKGMMGNDFADAISTGGLFVSSEKLAEIVPTLPRGDAELFDTLLRSVGIHPVAKEAAHEAGGLDGDELRLLASVHNGM